MPVKKKNACRRNVELSRFHNGNEYSKRFYRMCIWPEWIGILSKECINCVALSFLAEYGRTKHNCCQYGKVELTNVNYPETLKNLLLGSHSDITRSFRGVGERQQEGREPLVRT